jgi:hypothetical protein
MKSPAGHRIGEPWAQPEGSLQVPLREEQRLLHGRSQRANSYEDKGTSVRSQGGGHLSVSKNNHTHVHTQAHTQPKHTVTHREAPFKLDSHTGTHTHS